MRTKGVFLLGLIVCWTAVCSGEDVSKYDIKIRDKLEKELAKEYLLLAGVAAPGESCTDNEDCGEREICDVGTDDSKICKCATGVGGDTCQEDEFCKKGQQFENCKGINGTCKYSKEDRKVVCKCDDGKKLHPKENRCRATCEKNADCENGGTCGDDKFCSCKLGIIGDKCETIFDCTSEGKYKGCVDSGGQCTYDDSKAVCTCADNKKYHDTEHLCKECSCGNDETCKFENGKKQCDCNSGFARKEGICTATCSNNDGCNEKQKCGEINSWKTCVCADGLTGTNCEKNDWCEDTGKFKNCKGENGTCVYVKDKRSVDCTCTSGKALHPNENRCRDTCANNNDCKNGGTCNENFCSCKLGLIGDKCETIFDCTVKGKYKGCEGSSGKCTHDGKKAICTCPTDQKYHDTEHVCKECNCGPDGTCRFENGQKTCDCNSGFADKGGLCTATCSNNDGCNEKQKCLEINNWNTCVCADGLSGTNCEKNEWCEGKFINCKGVNGTCEYAKDKRSVVCTCASGKALHLTENRCRDTCAGNGDCKYGGTCTDNFCTCKPGLFGDKCESIFDCTPEGKFKYCTSSGGTCSHDGNNAVCTCPNSKKLHDTERICKDKCSTNDDCKYEGTCENSICTCKSGLTGDKCETVIDCEANGKYKNCRSNGGTCSYEGGNTVCNCPDNKKYDEKDHTCKPTCSNNDGCNEKQKCEEINGWNTCVCADGLSGADCEKKDWCEVTGKFKNCKGENGTCDYVKEKRSVDCTCTSGKALHSTENRCRDTCASDGDCKNGGTCVDNFCTCKPGLIGDKCETVFACSPEGKYKNCASSGGTCSYDGNNAVCTCPGNKKLHDTEHICKECNCGSKGTCRFENGQPKCDCESGFAVKDGICTATCTNNEGCNEKQKCGEINGWKTCVCADGLSGANCEKKHWCEGTGKFKNCKGENGTCEYVKDKRSVDCTCTSGKALHPNENRCRETCNAESDCEYEGKCEANKFCSCKLGLIGDKCETVFDCTSDGKYKDCENSDGKCSYEGSKGVCKCPDHKQLHEKEHICKEFCDKKEDCNGGECQGAEGKKICSCPTGLKGDKCQIIKDCVEGKYSKCESTGGECKFDGTKAICSCTGSKTLDTKDNVCREKCDNDCKNEGTCIAETKLCNCKPGTSGDKCETIDCGTLKCEEKKAKCIFKDGKATCECDDKNFYYDNNECKPEWCKNECSKDSVCDYQNGVGVCKCKAEGTYYNYAAGKCEKIDKCFNKTCGAGEVCKAGDCVCDDNHQKKGEKCEPKEFCDNKNSICFTNALCEPGKSIGYVSCTCNDTLFYNPRGKKCDDGKCLLPEHKKDCTKSCPNGMERKDGDCKYKVETSACDKDCGKLGWCFNFSASSQKCVCETGIAEIDKKTGKCVLKATAVCPTTERDGDDKCKCTGQYKPSKNGITCDLKSCSDEDVQNICKKKRAEKCVDNWKKDGYKCVCPFGYTDDPEKGCIDPCSVGKMKDTCLSQGKVCYIGSKDKEGDCRCLPTFTENPTKTACELSGKNTYMIQNLPVMSKKYENAEKNINKVLLNIDVSASMKQAFKKLDFAHVLNFKIQEGVLLCDVWLQFELKDLPDKFDAFKEVQRWKSHAVEANNQKLLPPGLYMSDNLNDAIEKELTLCSPSVKLSVCGRGSDCVNNACNCSAGFREIDSTIQTYGDKGRIVRCEDIDECKEETHECPDNSQCVNTEGDYFCRCKPGYRKKEGAADELDKKACIGLCEAKPCGKGECKLTKENNVDCTCPAGYRGSFCNRKDENLAKASQATKVVGAVLGTLLAIVIILIIVYVVRQRKNSYSEDFTPAPRNDNAEMIERRPMRGVTNRAYQ